MFFRPVANTAYPPWWQTFLLARHACFVLEQTGASVCLCNPRLLEGILLAGGDQPTEPALETNGTPDKEYASKPEKGTPRTMVMKRAPALSLLRLLILLLVSRHPRDADASAASDAATAAASRSPLAASAATAAAASSSSLTARPRGDLSLPWPPSPFRRPSSSSDPGRRRWWFWDNPPASTVVEADESGAASEEDECAGPPPRCKAAPLALGPPATTTRDAARRESIARVLLRDVPRLAVEHRRDWGRWAAGGIQVGLVVLLVRSAWKVATELLDELAREVSGAGGGTPGSEPLLVAPERLPHVLAACEVPPPSEPERAADADTPPPLAECPPHVLAVVRGLLSSGLPLRDMPGSPTASVESVLRHLTAREAGLLRQCLWTHPSPLSNGGGWEDVVGLDRVKEHLRHSIAALRGHHHPARHAFRALFEAGQENSAAADPSPTDPATSPGGVLLFGPPGCGKTLLVRSLAAASRVPCLVVTPSTLLRQYVGETNRQVRNLFSLAQKLAPCILCVDELDGLFRERSDTEHDVSRDLKTEFLQWWDGMLSDPAASFAATFTPSSHRLTRRPILVIGATNRPFDVDAAVLRRLPHAHYVGLPDTNARASFVRALLARVPSLADVSEIAALTEGYSPSDLRQLLQLAATLGPLRNSVSAPAEADPAAGSRAPRPLTTDDVRVALRHARPTPLSPTYRRALRDFARQSLGPYSGEAPLENDGRTPGAGSPPLEPATRWLWETRDGTFYHLGQLELDRRAFEVLSDVVQHLSRESSSPEASSESEDSDGDDEHD